MGIKYFIIAIVLLFSISIVFAIGAEGFGGGNFGQGFFGTWSSNSNDGGGSSSGGGDGADPGYGTANVNIDAGNEHTYAMPNTESDPVKDVVVSTRCVSSKCMYQLRRTRDTSDIYKKYSSSYKKKKIKLIQLFEIECKEGTITETDFAFKINKDQLELPESVDFSRLCGYLDIEHTSDNGGESEVAINSCQVEGDVLTLSLSLGELCLEEQNDVA